MIPSTPHTVLRSALGGNDFFEVRTSLPAEDLTPRHLWLILQYATLAYEGVAEDEIAAAAVVQRWLDECAGRGTP